MMDSEPAMIGKTISSPNDGVTEFVLSGPILR